jgi:hypothetical protein
MMRFDSHGSPWLFCFEAQYVPDINGLVRRFGSLSQRHCKRGELG